MKKADPRFAASVACLANGDRLLGDALCVEFEQPAATMYFLSLIAQEEFAKGFLLYLVSMGVIPWKPSILRATKDHKCKHLVGIVIDFLTPDDDVFFERLKNWPAHLPAKVADALNILRHEKIGRWESKNWFWVEDPQYDAEALNVADGKLDAIKQDSIYVKLAKDGSLLSTPCVTEDVARYEHERGKRFSRFMKALSEITSSKDPLYQDVEDAFKNLFTDPAKTHKDVHGGNHVA